jgi:hypothetical protein
MLLFYLFSCEKYLTFLRLCTSAIFLCHAKEKGDCYRRNNWTFFGHFVRGLCVVESYISISTDTRPLLESFWPINFWSCTLWNRAFIVLICSTHFGRCCWLLGPWWHLWWSAKSEGEGLDPLRFPVSTALSCDYELRSKSYDFSF